MTLDVIPRGDRQPQLGDIEAKAGSSAQAPEVWKEQDPVPGFIPLLPSFPSI